MFIIENYSTQIVEGFKNAAGNTNTYFLRYDSGGSYVDLGTWEVLSEGPKTVGGSVSRDACAKPARFSFQK